MRRGVLPFIVFIILISSSIVYGASCVEKTFPTCSCDRGNQHYTLYSTGCTNNDPPDDICACENCPNPRASCAQDYIMYSDTPYNECVWAVHGCGATFCEIQDNEHVLCSSYGLDYRATSSSCQFYCEGIDCCELIITTTSSTTTIGDTTSSTTTIPPGPCPYDCNGETCKMPGEMCHSATECCYWMCNYGIACVDCLGNRGMCSYDRQCCSGSCVAGSCSGTGITTSTTTTTGTTTTGGTTTSSTIPPSDCKSCPDYHDMGTLNKGDSKNTQTCDIPNKGVDWLKVHVTESETLTITEEGPSGCDYDLSVHETCGGAAVRSSTSDACNEEISFSTVAPKDYYIRVYAHTGSGRATVTASLAGGTTTTSSTTTTVERAGPPPGECQGDTCTSDYPADCCSESSTCQYYEGYRYCVECNDNNDCDGKCDPDDPRPCVCDTTKSPVNGGYVCVLGCTREGHCEKPEPHCLTEENVCVECRNENDCESGESCIDYECVSECSHTGPPYPDPGCQDSTRRVCDDSVRPHKCVACLPEDCNGEDQTECTCPGEQICSPEKTCVDHCERHEDCDLGNCWDYPEYDIKYCKECGTNTDCVGLTDCDNTHGSCSVCASNGKCVECTNTDYSKCHAGERCHDNKCTMNCYDQGEFKDSICEEIGKGYCLPVGSERGVCVDCNPDPDHPNSDCNPLKEPTYCESNQICLVDDEHYYECVDAECQCTEGCDNPCSEGKCEGDCRGWGICVPECEQVNECDCGNRIISQCDIPEGSENYGGTDRVCDTDVERCVGCRDHRDCPADPAWFCFSDNQRCEQCRWDNCGGSSCIGDQECCPVSVNTETQSCSCQDSCSDGSAATRYGFVEIRPSYDQVNVGQQNQYTAKNCNYGLWIVIPKEGQPLLYPIVQEMSGYSNTITFTPGSSGTIKTILVCLDPEIIVRKHTSTAEELVKMICDETCMSNTECRCSIEECGDGTLILTGKGEDPTKPPIDPLVVEFSWSPFNYIFKPTNTGTIKVVTICRITETQTISLDRTVEVIT